MSKELTLEELIEKCGDKFWSLVWDGTFWTTTDMDGKIEVKGKSAKQAVQNLLKELEKHD